MKGLVKKNSVKYNDGYIHRDENEKMKHLKFRFKKIQTCI